MMLADNDPVKFKELKEMSVSEYLTMLEIKVKRQKPERDG